MSLEQEVIRLRQQVDRLSSFETPNCHWVNWAPAYGGFAVDPVGVIARYMLLGRLCIASVSMPNSGTSNNAGFTVSLPVQAATIVNATWLTSAIVVDNGVQQALPGAVVITNGALLLNVYKDFTGAGFTAAGGKRAYFTIQYEI